jgi:hypothetical protein
VLWLFAARPEQYRTLAVEMPGAGSVAPNRYTTMMPRVNRSFLRRSGVRNARANIASLATVP